MDSPGGSPAPASPAVALPHEVYSKRCAKASMPALKRFAVRRNALLAKAIPCADLSTWNHSGLSLPRDGPDSLTGNSRGRENRRFPVACQRQKKRPPAKMLN